MTAMVLRANRRHNNPRTAGKGGVRIMVTKRLLQGVEVPLAMLRVRLERTAHFQLGTAIMAVLLLSTLRVLAM